MSQTDDNLVEPVADPDPPIADPGADSRDHSLDEAGDVAAEGSEGDPGEGKDELTQLSEDKDFLVDQLQRARAELENFRRRTVETRRSDQRRMTADVFRRVLPLFDDLRLALDSDAGGDGMKEGVRIILDEVTRVLEEFRIEIIASTGHPFDPAVHEAMFHEETDAVPDGEVLEEFERGYRIEDNLIRPARVKVAKAPTQHPPAQE